MPAASLCSPACSLLNVLTAEAADSELLSLRSRSLQQVTLARSQATYQPALISSCIFITMHVLPAQTPSIHYEPRVIIYSEVWVSCVSVHVCVCASFHTVTF